MKTKNKIFAVVLAALMIVSAVAALSACQPSETVYGMNYSYVSVSINPEADFVIDENGLVADVIPMNEDAEVLLAGNIDRFIGLTAEEAVELFTQMAVEAGYIDVDTELTEVNVEVVSDESEESATQLAERIRERVNKYFANNGIFGRVNIENLDEYLVQVEALGIDVDGISLGKLKAMMTVLSLMPDTDLEELSQMTVGEMIKLIHGETSETGVKVQNAEFAQAKQELFQNKYGDITELRAQIQEMEQQIASMQDGDEKTAMVQQLETLRTQLRERVQAYKNEVDALKEQYKQQAQTAQQERQNACEEKVEQNKAKIQNQQQRVQQNFEQIKSQIENMQQNGQGQGQGKGN